MKNIINKRTLLVRRENESLMELEAAGFTNDLAKKIITNQIEARGIMGQNMFGVEEAIMYWGDFTVQQAAPLSKIPFSSATLEKCKETHILVAVFPTSINDIRGKIPFKLFYDKLWSGDELFVNDRGNVSWELVRKTPVENSTKKTWKDQQMIIPNNEKVPTARVMAYVIISHYLATGERLFELSHVRCSDVDQYGSRIYVGGFDKAGLDILGIWDVLSLDDVGVSSVWEY